MNQNIPMRRAALRMIANGSATMAEVAELAGVSRQAVRHWVETAGINPVHARAKRVRKLWNVVYGEANRVEQ